jgi:hypothetical protein
MLSVGAGIPPLQLSRFTGHAKATTALAIYTHLFDDDHAETMAALEAMSRPVDAPNVVPMRRRMTGIEPAYSALTELNPGDARRGRPGDGEAAGAKYR